MRDEAVHRDTRPELRPTSHKSRSLDCKICEHIGTIKSAPLVRGSPPVYTENDARTCVPVRVSVCACWRRGGGREGGCVCVCACVCRVVGVSRGREGVSVFSAVHL